MNKKEYAKSFLSGKCDKCGKIVTKDNSALLVEELATEQFAGFVSDRHLYPVDGCEGSPSRQKEVAKNKVWQEALEIAKEKG